MFFKATKTNSQFEHSITKSTGQECVHSKISHITVLESIKQLRDAKYKELLKSGPKASEVDATRHSFCNFLGLVSYKLLQWATYRVSICQC